MPLAVIRCYEDVFIVFSEGVFLNFSHCIAGKGGDLQKLFGAFVGGEVGFKGALKGVFIEGCTPIKHDEGHGGFAHIGIGHADDGAFQNAELGIEHVFDFLGVNVVAA